MKYLQAYDHYPIDGNLTKLKLQIFLFLKRRGEPCSFYEIIGNFPYEKDVQIVLDILISEEVIELDGTRYVLSDWGKAQVRKKNPLYRDGSEK
jgi:predicted transcriptional regulator